MCVGRFGDLTEVEQDLLVKMTEQAKPGIDNVWLLSPAQEHSALIGVGGPNTVKDVPASRVTYQSLDRKGYLASLQPPGHDLQVRIEQQGLDYGAYARKPKVARSLQDFAYDMVTEGTVWGKLGWVVLGSALTLLGSWLLG